MVAYTRRVMKVVQADPNVADVQGDEGGDMNISLKPLSERDLSADEVATELRAKLRNIPGTAITFIQSAHHPHRRARLALHLSIHACRAWTWPSCSRPPTS